MKVLVATKETQGTRKNDFSFTNEGELVKLGFECDGEETDGNCGCRRSMVGFNTLKATTTFKVIEKEITRDEFLKLFEESEKRAGWGFTKEDIEWGDDLLRIAQQFTPNCILEKRGDKIQVRTDRFK